MSHNQSTLQGMTIKEHERNKRVLEMRIIHLDRENREMRLRIKNLELQLKSAQKQAMSLKEWQKYMQVER